MVGIMNQAEYGKYRGVTQQTVSKYIRTGKIPGDCLTEEIENGRTYTRVIVDKADAALSENLSKAKKVGSAATNIVILDSEMVIDRDAEPDDQSTHGAGISDDATFSEAQRLDMIYKARLKEIDLAEKEGTLCPLIDFETSLSSMGRATRNMLQGIGSRLSAGLAAESDPAKCKRMIDEAHYDAIIAAIPEKYHEQFGIGGELNGESNK